MKHIQIEEFIAVQQENKTPEVTLDDLPNVKFTAYNGDKNDRTLRKEKPIPVSPLLGPYKVD